MKTFRVEWKDQSGDKKHRDVSLEKGDRFNAMSFIFALYGGSVQITNSFELTGESNASDE